MNSEVGFKSKIERMKTPIEQIIDEINSTQVHFFDKKTVELLRTLRNKATELLETEKKQIVGARMTAPTLPYAEEMSYLEEAEDYFNNTYKK